MPSKSPEFTSTPRSVYALSSAIRRSERFHHLHRGARVVDIDAPPLPSAARIASFPQGDIVADLAQRVAHFQRHDDHADRQLVGLGEFPVALVVARHRHHRAGAVVHEHEVGDENRQVLTGDRMDRAQAGID